jgi:hypothetical protein
VVGDGAGRDHLIQPKGAGIEQGDIGAGAGTHRIADQITYRGAPPAREAGGGIDRRTGCAHRTLRTKPLLKTIVPFAHHSSHARVRRQRRVDRHPSHCLAPVSLAAPEGDELRALGIGIRFDDVPA